MKVTKRSVNYRRARKGAKRRCGSCSMLRTGHSGYYCTLVAGLIRRADVCDRWEAK